MVSSTVWGGLAVVGVKIIMGARNQGIHGFPNQGQISYYIFLPVALTFLAIAAYLLAHRGRFIRSAFIVQLGVLLFVLPYMLFFTGGM